MTVRLVPRPVLRRLFKPLLGALLVLLGILAPVEAPDLPPPLDDLAGAAPASAQTPPPSTVIRGTPDPCPDPADLRWQPNATDSSLCEIRDFACSEHPLQPGTYLAPSVQYPDFCETTILEPTSPSMYQACTSVTGYVRQLTTPPTGRECRLIQPARCASQLHRTGFNTCLRVRRRTWSCPAGTFPRNKFNSCYQPPPAYMGTNPACQSGAPAFPITTCEEYVGGNFERNPAAVACSSFPTGDPRTVLQDHLANQHWCRYNTSFLDVGCHATGAACTPSDAYCVKRSSRTGGCDVVAETLRCRGLQADYLDPYLTVSANDVYQQGCTPCVVLPFRSVPAECPSELSQNPSLSTNLRHQWAHTYKEDYLEGRAACVVSAHNTGVMTPTCLRRVRCIDPPRGRIVWESNHHSGFAIVNSFVTLNIEDIPNRTREVQLLGVAGSPQKLYTTSSLQYEYSNSSLGDPVIRTWYRVDTSRTHTSVDGIVSGGECVVRDWPDFRVLIEELWPDNDEIAIEDLLGAGTLDWWRALTPLEKTQHTEARGLQFIVGMTPADRDLELERRATVLNQEIRCNFGDNVWCKWTPPRSGYYRLTAAGGWHMRTFGGGRGWLQPFQIQGRENFLQNSVSPGDGDCPYRGRYEDFNRGSDYDCIMDRLGLMGVTPQEIGLQDDPITQTFTGLIPSLPYQDDEWLYSAAAGENFRCPPRDLRITCGGSGGGINYTESEPVGIQVYEMRVNTVTPTY